MNSHVSDSEFENLINETDLGLLQDAPLAAAPAPEVARPNSQDLSFFGKLPVNVTLEVASTEVALKDLMEIDTNSVIMLDKLAGEPLDVKVNGALFAKAEVVVMNGNYGLRITELSGTGLSALSR
ncbi:flagellar motor switch protein FliN [Pseudomonas sp. L-22-4S-12]|uniref:flagellar motor switch protein FliN n=1 Tax=Pseudomonas sp. L-22-4S-12 TaxID=2610893 RepID=UPI00132066E2|nr:flagellar motor switch protein FliN [Pseudomonas sp. L-22-4S-12]MWV17391.1 flagellar motor switch protein FliN [Pseudomonas sp. L-22-4S-12]